MRFSVLYRFFLPFLFVFSGAAYADWPKKITAHVGETVLLPCNITLEGDLPTVEWSKEDISPNITFLYRDGCETFEEKNPDFLYRTNLVLNKLKDGNLSQVIYSVRLSDSGRYLCMTRRGRSCQVEETVDLTVVAVSEPKLTVVPSSGDGVTLQCEAECWLLEPEITFLDDQGKEIEAGDPKRHESTGCHTTTRRATLQTSTRRVTCRVHQQMINQTRDANIHIPANCTTSFTILISVFVTFLVTCGLWICGVYLYKKYVNTDCRQKRHQSLLRLNQSSNQAHVAQPPQGETHENPRSGLSENNNSNYKSTELDDRKSKHSPAPPCGPPSRDSTSAPNGSEQINQLPYLNRPTASSSTSLHSEPDNSSKTKDSTPAESIQSLEPGPQVEDVSVIGHRAQRSVSFVDPRSPTCSPVRSFSLSSIGKSLRRPSLSNHSSDLPEEEKLLLEISID